MSRVRFGLGVQAVSATLGQALAIGLLPVLTRLAPPAVFGAYAPIMALSVVGSVIGVLRLEQIILLSDDPNDLRLVRGVTLIASAVGGAGLGLTATSLLGRSYAESAAAGLLYSLTVVNRVWTLYRVREGEHLRIATAGLLESGGTALFQIGLILVGVDGVLALLAGRTCAMIVGSLPVAPKPLKTIQLVGPRSVLELLRRHRSVVLMDLPGSIANTLSWQSPVLAVTAVFGDASAGIYSMAYRLLRFPANILGAPASRVFTSELVARTASQKHDPRRLVRDFTAGTTAAALLLFCPLWIVPGPWLENLFSLALGPEWGGAAGASRALAPWIATAFAVSHLGVVFLRTGRLAPLLGFNLVLLGTRLSSFGFGAVSGNFDLMLWALSISGLFVYIALYPLALRQIGFHNQGSPAVSGPARSGADP